MLWLLVWTGDKLVVRSLLGEILSEPAQTTKPSLSPFFFWSDDSKQRLPLLPSRCPPSALQVLEATDTQPWGPHGTLMGEIAKLTNNDDVSPSPLGCAARLRAASLRAGGARSPAAATRRSPGRLFPDLPRAVALALPAGLPDALAPSTERFGSACAVCAAEDACVR